HAGDERRAHAHLGQLGDGKLSPAAKADVGRGHRRRRDADAHLTGPGLRLRQLRNFQDLRATQPGERHPSHGRLPAHSLSPTLRWSQLTTFSGTILSTTRLGALAAAPGFADAGFDCATSPAPPSTPPGGLCRTLTTFWALLYEVVLKAPSRAK